MKDEEAKAIQAVAKAVPRMLDSVDAVGRFFEESLGYPIKEASGFLGDWIKFKRDNWRLTCQKVQAELDRRGVAVSEIQPLPAKYGVAIIEKASLEDSEIIQDMWAGLLANSLDPSCSQAPKRMFISILSELEPVDAQVLNKLYIGRLGMWTVSTAQGVVDVSKEEFIASLQNLRRLGLVVSVDGYVDIEKFFNDLAAFSFTSLAGSLLRSVRPADAEA